MSKIITHMFQTREMLERKMFPILNFHKRTKNLLKTFQQQDSEYLNEYRDVTFN